MIVKQRVRFGSIKIGDSFEWNNRSFKKDGNQSAFSLIPRGSFIFNLKDLVTIDAPEVMLSEFDYIPSCQPKNPQDYFDDYIPTDTCN